MSHLRRRHGRASLPRLRRQLRYAAVLPATFVTICAAGAVLFVLWSSGIAPSRAAWAVLAGAAVAAVLAVGIAAVAADRQARSVQERLAGLSHSIGRSQAELHDLVERLRRGEGAPQRRPADTAPAGAQRDDFALVAQELERAHEMAFSAVVHAAQIPDRAGAGSEQKVEVFVNLARRLQSLVHREIQLLDELENEVEDPELLKGLFHVDHLATRIRRHAENLAVLGGAISRRQWSNPVTLTEVVRSSIAEVEQYSRVKLVPPIDSTLRGHAVADVIHLLAELVENASVFSAPNTQVLLRASHVTAGLAIEVEDRGLGMPVAEQNKLNGLLADPDQVDVADLLSDGRIGLFVVSALSRRHGIAVRLQTNIYGGVQAVIVLPRGLLGDDAPTAADTAPAAPEQPREQVAATAAAVPHPRTEAAALTLHTATHTRVAHVPRQAPADAARATDGRPQLPQRRAQEHLMPQLRDAPAPRAGHPEDSDDDVVHDPGLMAAFQRGIDRAESE
ncbi:sensor histidine kinase [Streptomyces sp. A7024]|uniref:histidine kinase n=1 Tax=Streptomyces coryli TaxID=1128680 RepID=A0A6G4U179_9ACTN|nr:sensor histidine kinase [Streptomyces coryli]